MRLSHWKLFASAVFVLLPSSAWAQRLDGCIDQRQPSAAKAPLNSFTEADRDRALREAGYSLSQSSLRSALKASDPALRSIAAMRLASLGGRDDVAIIARVFSSETDPCTKLLVAQSLAELTRKYWAASPQHTKRVPPFQPCTASSPPILSLRVEQVQQVRTRPHAPTGPLVRITVRNLTSEMLPFLSHVDVAGLFSVSVFGSDGHRAAIPSNQTCYYQQCDPRSDPTLHESCIAHCTPGLLPLLPQQDVTIDWYPGEDFDMSTPGLYQVSLGAKLDYLDTTVCSNIASVAVR